MAVTNADMDGVLTFPHKCPLAQIALGLCALVTGAVFALIVVGVHTLLWEILMATSLSVGVLCTLTGSLWCWYSVRRPQTNLHLSGRLRECEETVTSEATEIPK